MEEPIKMEKTNLDGAQELPQAFSCATNTGEKRKREGLVRRDEESRNSSETEEVIFVGDTKAIKEFGFDGGEQSLRSVFSKRRAFDVQWDSSLKGSLEKEETVEEPERAKHVSTFNDFGKLREESSFAVGQTWVLYDTDGMPRLYARIREVSVPGFGLSVTWLEPDPDEEEEVKMREKELPVSLGKFRLGKNESIKDRRRFSHVVHCNEGSSTGKFSVYPTKGETWAVFKGRYKPGSYGDVDWSPDPESIDLSKSCQNMNTDLHLLGSCIKQKAFSVCFVALLRKLSHVTFVIIMVIKFINSPSVPSFKITGNEAEGMPRGAYELDPRALPENITEINVPLHLLAEPRVPNSENSQCVYFASKGTTFETGQIWSFCSGDDNLPRYYGKIQKITFIQVFEQDPVMKLHVGRLKAAPIKGVMQWIDKKMPIGCGKFRARKVLEIFTDLDMFSRQISLDSSGDGNVYSIMPKTGDVWAIYRNWSNDIQVIDLQSQTYDLVEVLNDKLDYKALLLAPDGGFKSANSAGFGSVYMAATEHWIDGADVRFTIPKSELLRFSHQVLTSKVTKEIRGAMQEVYEPNIGALPVNLIL